MWISDPFATRRRILKEYRKVQAHITIHPQCWRSETFRAHKRVCAAMGENYVNFPEFEFWFARFSRGDFNLDYDRRSDPKARSLTDLPLEIFNKIGENLHLDTKMQLRDVCKDIRFQVDNWDLKLAEISYSSADVWKVKRTPGYGAAYVGKFHQDENNRYSSGYYQNLISFVMSVLKLPKLQVEKLTIHRQDEYWEKLIKRLDESNRKLPVKNVEYPDCHHSSKIDLHFLVPGVLEEIKMFPVDPKRRELYDFVESEQCQAAKMVHIESWTAASRFPLDILYNCPRFTLYLYGPADGLKSRFLKNLMKYGEVQKCVLYLSKYRAGQSQIMKYFNEPEAMVPDCPSLRRYPIPGTNEYYEIEYREEFEFPEGIEIPEGLEIPEEFKVNFREEFVRFERKP